jgi:hypothetical protein
MGQEEHYSGFGWFKPGTTKNEQKRVSEIAQKTEYGDSTGDSEAERLFELTGIAVPKETQSGEPTSKDIQQLENQAEFFNNLAHKLEILAHETVQEEGGGNLKLLERELSILNTEIEHAELFSKRNPRILQSTDYQKMLAEQRDLEQKIAVMRTRAKIGIPTDSQAIGILASEFRAHAERLLALSKLPWPSDN